MNKLQNNFTTLEQSKKLLELGVPTDSADCCLNGDYVIILNGKTFQENYNEDLDLARLHLMEYPHYVPCWSCGRLIEIYEICTQKKFNRRNQTDNLVYLSPTEDVMMQIEHNACGFYDNTKWDINLLTR